MAITTPTLTGPGSMPITRTGPRSFNNDEDDATPAVECVAAPGAGKAIYLTHVTISGGTTDVAVTLLDSAAVLFGPITCQADGGSILTKDFEFPMKLTDNQALNVSATDGVAFCIYGEYFIGEKPTD